MKTLDEKIQFVSENRDKLTPGQRTAFSHYKGMLRNLKEEGGRLGGESGIAPNAIRQFESFLDKCINGF